MKYIISFGKENIFTLEISPIFTDKKTLDFPAMFSHVKELVGTGATIELA